MEKYVDLHIHTIYSDSNLSPKELIEYAKKLNLSAVGITDHDTTDGIEEAIKEANKYGIEVVPGIEISAIFNGSSENEVHILGYYIDWQDEELQEKLKLFRKARIERAYKILEKLKLVGINIDVEKIITKNNNSSIGRLHFARLLVEQKRVNSIKEAFDLYLGYGRCAYVPKFMFSVEEAISMILKAKGIPVLAHPYISIYNDNESFKKLIKQGIKGIEVFHSNHHKNVEEELMLIAEKYGLLITGGSDCHGKLDNLEVLLGSIKVPYVYLENLKKYKERCCS
ncbi:MAG: PHP domain-containing protein [Elusimicrobiota bacterium]|nr:PHP domain-containing protein [Endomicrobiia bacterium]MCX7910207.1 PHP domain-containing protein [Endomicrobiia bacterium]MDW8165276.1 PHP domain-containing protein [Elusimicrobiota bacterium]